MRPHPVADMIACITMTDGHRATQSDVVGKYDPDGDISIMPGAKVTCWAGAGRQSSNLSTALVEEVYGIIQRGGPLSMAGVRELSAWDGNEVFRAVYRLLNAGRIKCTPGRPGTRESRSSTYTVTGA